MNKDGKSKNEKSIPSSCPRRHSTSIWRSLSDFVNYLISDLQGVLPVLSRSQDRSRIQCRSMSRSRTQCRSFSVSNSMSVFLGLEFNIGTSFGLKFNIGLSPSRIQRLGLEFGLIAWVSISFSCFELHLVIECFFFIYYYFLIFFEARSLV